MVWVDFDGDGLDDVIRYVPGGAAHFLRNDGAGGFSLAEGEGTPVPSGVRHAIAVPLEEGDGDALVLVTAENTLVVRLAPAGLEVVDRLPVAGAVHARDFDDDGLTDLVLDGTIYRRAETGAFVKVELPELPVEDWDAPMQSGELTDGDWNAPSVVSQETAIRDLADGIVTSDKIALGAVGYRHLAPEVQLAGQAPGGRDGDPTKISGADDPGENLVEPASRVRALGTDGDLVVTGLIRGHGEGGNTLAGSLGIGYEGYGESIHVSHSDATSDGIGSWIFSTTTTGAAVKGQTYGTGPGILGYSQSGFAGVQGNGGSGHGVSGTASIGAGVYGASGTGAGVYGKSSDGHAGHFEITVSDNGAYAVNGTTEGTGHAGRFAVHNPDNGNSALSVLHEGIGPGLGAVTTGTGGAAWFDVRNPSTAATAVSVSNAGTGRALNVTQTNSAAFYPAIEATTEGTGNAIWGETSGLGNAFAGQATGDGHGLAVLSRGAGSAIFGEAYGLAPSAWFVKQSNARQPVLLASHAAGGVAVHGQTTRGSAVFGEAVGDGTGVKGTGDTGVWAVGRSKGLLAQTYDATGWAAEIHNIGNIEQSLLVRGTAQVRVLEITGGADLAERFEVMGDAPPGTVLAIDPSCPGALRVSRDAYDPTVAGVVSGANDLSAGIVLTAAGGSDDGVAVALTGRVWVRADATSGAIAPGDLLTTAARPGHAMLAADPARAHGAVIGKAMSALSEGEVGMVLALVQSQ